jgi:hypothetical protein
MHAAGHFYGAASGDLYNTEYRHGKSRSGHATVAPTGTIRPVLICFNLFAFPVLTGTAQFVNHDIKKLARQPE